MIHLTAQTTIFIATQPIDFRRQIDGLVALCDQHLHQNPRSGALYVFINRARTMIRILHHDGSAYWLATRRLSQGRYQGWPTGSTTVLPAAGHELRRLIKSTHCERVIS